MPSNVRTRHVRNTKSGKPAHGLSPEKHRARIQSQGPKLIAKLRALKEQGIPLNPTNMMKKYPRLYRHLCAVFGTYRIAIETGLKISYTRVRLPSAEIKRRQRESSKKITAGLDERERHRLMVPAIRQRMIVMRKRSIRQRARVLSYRLQGYSIPAIMRFMTLKKFAIVKRTSHLKRILPKDLLDRLTALERERRFHRGTFKISGSLVMNKSDAIAVARSLEREWLKKFSGDLKTVYQLALDKKSNQEIADAVNLPLSEVINYLLMLTDKQNKEVRMVRLRQSGSQIQGQKARAEQVNPASA